MIASLISLASILIGIIGANITGFIFKKLSFGITGNTIIGVFSSVFFIKAFGRFGIDPKIIVQLNNVNYILLSINFLVSFLSAAISLFLSLRLKKLINNQL